MEDSFLARGHPAITSLHPTTMEITKETHLTARGDCIVAVGSSKACIDLSEGLKRAIRGGAQLFLLLEVDGLSEEVRGVGHPGLSLRHPTDMVFRKSGFVCPRTVFIHADKAARDLDRELVERLRRPDARVKVTIGTL